MSSSSKPPKLKRTRDELESGIGNTSDSARPTFKKTKKAKDPLRNHLPEFEGSEENHDLSQLRKAILKKAKKKNTIGFLPRQTAIEPIYYDFLKWAVELEKAAELPEGQKHHKSAVFIVEKAQSIKVHGEHACAKISGATCSTDIFGKDRKASRHADILITTSQKFLEALSLSVLKMHNIHSILIEDAQAIRNQDSHSFLPVVRLMNDYYMTIPESSRPRICAIAISSASSPNNFDSKMLRLEQVLASLVSGVTAERWQEVSDLPDRPDERVILYDQASAQQTKTALYKQLRDIDKNKKVARKYFRAADVALAQLGSCAADLVWKPALKDIEESIPTWHEDDGSDPSQRVLLRIRDAIQNCIFAMPNLNPSAAGFNVSHKFLRLLQALESCKGYGETFKGVVLVQHRPIAYVLAEMLRMLNDKLPFARAIALSGREVFLTQQEIFSNFANGKYNLLIATRSIEDLDIPKASVIIRFDLFDGQISHAQASACANGGESHLIHLVKRNDDDERHLLNRSSTHSIELLHWAETLHLSPRVAVPPCPVKGNSQTYLSDSEDDSSDREFLTHPVTGGRVHLENATGVFICWVSRLESGLLEKAESMSLFKFQVNPGKKERRETSFTCSISLPGTEIDGLVGPPAPTQHLARRAAAFEACRRLLSLGLLDHQVVPLPSSLSVQRRGLEDLNSEKTAGTRRYPRQQPTFWTHGHTGPVFSLYPTVITVSSDGEPYAPIVVLTRQPFPSPPPFNLFMGGKALPIKLYSGAAISLAGEQANLIHAFTLRLFRSILNKPFACDLEAHTFLLAPLASSWKIGEILGVRLPQLGDRLDWDLMKNVAEKWAVAIDTSRIEEDMADALIQDRWLEFTRRYLVVKVRKDMTPLSKPDPTDRENGYPSFLAFVQDKRQGFEGLKDNSQPLLQVDRVLSVLNNLSPRVKDLTPPAKSPAKYLIPELCPKFLLPASLFRTAVILPSALWKIDDWLVVKEMNHRFFDNAIREDLLYEALTAHGAGMEKDYERLELLGDSFLKYISSIFVFVANPTQNEGSLHISRQKLIANKSLLQASVRVNTPPYIRSTMFNVRTWVPPNYITLALTGKDKSKVPVADGPDVSGEAPPAYPPTEPPVGAVQDKSQDAGPSAAVSADTEGKMDVDQTAAELAIQLENPGQPSDGKKKAKKGRKKRQEEDIAGQPLGDKAIADVAEALIAAAYISGGREAALRVLKILTMPLPGITTWSDFGARVAIPLPHRVAQLRPGSAEAVEDIIGHKFSQPHLLAQAMTHTSHKSSGMTSYERLEFIGDAILDFMVVRFIFDRDHALSPGGLSLLKSAMVSNATLAAICVSCGLQDHLLFDSHQLAVNIREYAQKITEKSDQEYRDAEAEGRRPGQYWAGVEPPKALSDLIESIIGAVYISDNFSPVGAEAFFDNVLRPFFDKHITLQTLTEHPTKTLFELVQAHGCQAMKITRENVKSGVTKCRVIIHEEVVASDEGPTPTSAARSTSLLALEAIKEDTNVLWKICDCRSRAKDKNAWMAQGLDKALSSLIAEEAQ